VPPGGVAPGASNPEPCAIWPRMLREQDKFCWERAMPPIALLLAEGNEGGPGDAGDAQDRAALEPRQCRWPRLVSTAATQASSRRRITATTDTTAIIGTIATIGTIADGTARASGRTIDAVMRRAGSTGLSVQLAFFFVYLVGACPSVLRSSNPPTHTRQGAPDRASETQARPPSRTRTHHASRHHA
jgi:hypothetical protein